MGRTTLCGFSFFLWKNKNVINLNLQLKEIQQNPKKVWEELIKKQLEVEETMAEFMNDEVQMKLKKLKNHRQEMASTFESSNKVN